MTRGEYELALSRLALIDGPEPPETVMYRSPESPALAPMEMAHPHRSSWEQAQHTWHADRRTVRRYEEYPAKFADLYADAASRVDIGKGKDAETSFVLQYRRRLEEKPTAVQHAEAHLDSTATQLAAAKAAHAEAETAHAEVIAST